MVLYHLDYVHSMTHCFYKAKLHGMVCVENILTCDVVGFELACESCELYNIIFVIKYNWPNHVDL